MIDWLTELRFDVPVDTGRFSQPISWPVVPRTVPLVGVAQGQFQRDERRREDPADDTLGGERRCAAVAHQVAAGRAARGRQDVQGRARLELPRQRSARNRHQRRRRIYGSDYRLHGHRRRADWLVDGGHRNVQYVHYLVNDRLQLGASAGVRRYRYPARPSSPVLGIGAVGRKCLFRLRKNAVFWLLGTRTVKAFLSQCEFSAWPSTVPGNVSCTKRNDTRFARLSKYQLDGNVSRSGNYSSGIQRALGLVFFTCIDEFTVNETEWFFENEGAATALLSFASSLSDDVHHHRDPPGDVGQPKAATLSEFCTTNTAGPLRTALKSFASSETFFLRSVNQLFREIIKQNQDFFGAKTLRFHAELFSSLSDDVTVLYAEQYVHSPLEKNVTTDRPS